MMFVALIFAILAAWHAGRVREMLRQRRRAALLREIARIVREKAHDDTPLG